MNGKRLQKIDMTVSPESRHKRLVKYREYVARVIKRGTVAKRVAPVWDWEANGQKGTCDAFTRSEAKARMKELLSVKKLKEYTLVTRT